MMSRRGLLTALPALAFGLPVALTGGCARQEASGQLMLEFTSGDGEEIPFTVARLELVDASGTHGLMPPMEGFHAITPHRIWLPYAGADLPVSLTARITFARGSLLRVQVYDAGTLIPAAGRFDDSGRITVLYTGGRS